MTLNIQFWPPSHPDAEHTCSSHAEFQNTNLQMEKSTYLIPGSITLLSVDAHRNMEAKSEASLLTFNQLTQKIL